MTNKAASELGAKGGRARAENLTPEERSEIARAAVQARWEKAGKPRSRVPKATHDGTLPIGDMPCAVLEDGTRVLSERGVTKSLGGKRGGSHWIRIKQDQTGAKLPVYLSAGNLKPFIDVELAEALSHRIVYIPKQGGGTAYGIKAEMLPRVCDVFLKARDAGALTKPQQRLAAQADLIMRGLAHVGIIALVDEATGFQDDRARNALAKILEAFIAKELRPWVQTFPLDYYRELYRLRGLPYPPIGNKMPRYFGVLTNDIVYGRLAPGVLEELKRVTPRTETGRRKHHYHRKLTDGVGHPKLLQHLGSVVALMKVSPDGDYDGFKKLLDKHYPPQTALPLFDQPQNQNKDADPPDGDSA